MVAGKAGGTMRYHRDTTVTVDLDRLIENVTLLREQHYRGIALMAVVKADAYGQGAVPIAKTLEEVGVGAFAVATLEEALELRHAGIRGMILVLGSIASSDLELAAKRSLTLSVNHPEWLANALAKPFDGVVDVHLNIDTGMHRLGIEAENHVLDAVRSIRSSKHLRLSGVYTHLASSETPDETYYDMQIHRFDSLLSRIDTTGLWIHVANSGASVKKHPPFVNMVRIGLFLHGVPPSETAKPAFQLKPTLRLTTRIISIKHLPKGSKVSYNGIYETKEDDEIIATLPIGYADGYDRRYGSASVHVDGKSAPIVGRICMDYTMIRLSEEVPIGTEVELIGDHVSAVALADLAGTNSYHVFCQITDRVPRRYVRNGQVVQTVCKRYACLEEED
jgi:alanine racemase